MLVSLWLAHPTAGPSSRTRELAIICLKKKRQVSNKFVTKTCATAEVPGFLVGLPHICRSCPLHK